VDLGYRNPGEELRREKVIEYHKARVLDVVDRWNDILLTYISLRKIESHDKLTTHCIFPSGFMLHILSGLLDCRVGGRYRLYGRRCYSILLLNGR